MNEVVCIVCELSFEGRPDEEGQVTCPNCGAYFPIAWTSKYKSFLEEVANENGL